MGNWQGARAARRASGLLAVFVVVALLVACASDVPAADGPAPAVSGAEQDGAGTGGADAEDQLVIVDGVGRRLTFDRPPKRIISYTPSNTEILFAIGAGDLVVGVDDFSDYPPEVENLPHLGGLTEVDYERIVALEPDVFLVTTGADQIVGRVEELQIPVVVLKHERFDDLYANIELLGRLTGRWEGARALNAAIQARVAAVQEAVASVPPETRPRVFYEVWPEEPLMTAGPGSFIHDVIELAGGHNIFADADQAWPPVNLEDVVARDPQVIITPFQETYEAMKAGERPGWAGISAVENGRVHHIDQDLISRPGPRLIEALEQFAGWLHPEAP